MCYIIVGGSGYIGFNLAKRLKLLFPEERIVLTDIKPPPESEGFEYVKWDARRGVVEYLDHFQPSWIFNFAAIHRDPGHEREEYFDTNILGAERTCELARHTGCKNLFFTSSIAVYGPTSKATDEHSPLYPTTAYGVSKLVAEHVHQEWQVEAADRRLVICRPGVIYGPRETGNIPRMVRAIKRGRFAIPGSRHIHKSYGYIEGLIDSILFTCGIESPAFTMTPMSKRPARFIYNYVESPTETLGELTKIIQSKLGTYRPVPAIPLPLLVSAAKAIQLVTRGRSGFHPERVKKAATPTHIIPQALLNAGFDFRYNFARSLDDWRAKEPADF